MPAEKKKLLILGVLGVVLLSVGAFTLSGGGGSKPAPTPVAKPKPLSKKLITFPSATAPGTTSTASTSTPETGTLVASNAQPGANTANPLSKDATAPVAEQDYPERDPFDGRKYMPEDKKPAAPTTPTPPPAPSIDKHAAKIPPLSVGFDRGGLPTADASKLTGLPGAGEKPAIKVDDFDYTVTGVITGDRPAAVFVDAKGNQRLISLGGSLDGDTTVVAITRGRVTVEHHGKKRTLSVGADTPTEKR